MVPISFLPAGKKKRNGFAAWCSTCIRKGIKKESDYGSALPVLPKRLVQIYAHVLQEYIADQKKLEEKEPVLDDIFDQDIKEFLYQQASYFTAEQLHPLFESGYLDFSEFVKINSWSQENILEKWTVHTFWHS